MIQVVVDIRCTTKRGMGCYTLGARILEQLFKGDYYPSTLTIVSDQKGFAKLSKILSYDRNKFVINGHPTPTLYWDKIAKLNLTSTDFYLRISMCGLLSSTALPFQKNSPHQPRIIFISQPNFFANMSKFRVYTRQLPYSVHTTHLVGINKNRSGLPAAPQRSEEILLSLQTREFALAFVDSQLNNFQEAFIEFLRFLQLSQKTTHVVCIGKKADIQSAIELYVSKFSLPATFETNHQTQHYAPQTTRFGKQKNQIHIHAYNRVTPAQFHWLLKHSQPIMMCGSAMTVYEALTLGKLIFNQYSGMNRHIWYDLIKGFKQSIESQSIEPNLKKQLMLTFTYLANPTTHPALLGHCLQTLHNEQTRDLLSDSITNTVKERSGSLISSLRTNLHEIAVEKAQQRNPIKNRYFNRLGLFPRPKSSDLNTAPIQAQP